MPSASLKWSVIGLLLVYLVLFVTRTIHLVNTNNTLTSTKGCDENRSVDISDSRLSNFGSDNQQELDSSDVLAVDRVFPLTSTLNHVMEQICRKFSLYIQLENKKILFLKGKFLNLTFFDVINGKNVSREVFAMNPVISRIDTVGRLGNAYVSRNSDTVIVLVQKLRFKILKFKLDYYDSDFNPLGHSSFTLLKNVFSLNITLSTNYDNTKCQVTRVDLTFVPDETSFTLKCIGAINSMNVYALKSELYQTFRTGLLMQLKGEILPFLRKVIYQADICTYFDARSKNVELSELIGGSIFGV